MTFSDDRPTMIEFKDVHKYYGDYHALRGINGTIKANGGPVYLVAPNVENHGVITSPTGEVILAAGKTVELVNAGSPHVRVELTAPDNEVLNVGQVVANSGRIGIFGTAIRNSGTVSASAASVDAATGKIVFRAKKDITLDAGSRIEASGVQGGTVTVQAEQGTLLVDGFIEAINSLPPTAAGPSSARTAATGGTVQLLGERVGLNAGTRIDVSGDAGGGTST